MCLSFLFAISLTVFSKIARKRKRYRDYSILMILIPALRFLGIMSMMQLIFFFSVNLEQLGLTTTRHVNCCNERGSTIFVLWSALQLADTLLPVLFLLQRNFTIVSFLKSGLESCIVSAPIAILWSVYLFHGFSNEAPSTVRSMNKFVNVGVNVYLILVVCYILLRLWKSRHIVRMKPHIWSYALICIFLELYSAIFLSYIASIDAFDFGHHHDLTLKPQWVDGPLDLWYAVRIPILYYVYRKETLFWRLGVRGGEESNCSQLRQSLIVSTQTHDDKQFDDGTIESLQKVLLENRKITIDFFALELFEKIGEGATAEVYRGKLERRRRLKNLDVAVKLYTPQTIDSSLIREFADEISLMRNMKHRNISEV